MGGLSIWLASQLTSFVGTEKFPIARNGNMDGSADFSVSFQDFKAYCQGAIGNNNVFVLIQNSIIGNPVTSYTTTPSQELSTPTGNEIFLFTPTLTNAASPTLTINSDTPYSAILTKDSSTGLVGLSLNDLTPGTTYAVVKELTANTYQVIGKNTGGVTIQSDWLQTNSLLSDFIKNKPSIVDSNASSNSADTDPDLLTDLQSLIYNFTGYLNRIRIKTNGITFNKLRKISGQIYLYPTSSEIFGSVLGSNKQNNPSNSNQSVNVELSARIREWVPFSELIPMTAVNNYFTSSYGGIVGQKSFDDTNNILYLCYMPNKWIISGGKSGDGNPGFSNPSNCSSPTTGSEQYYEKDNRVFVNGIFGLTISTTATFSITITIPSGTTLIVGQGVVSGQGISGVILNISSTQVLIQADTTGNGFRYIAYSYSYKKS